MIIILSIVLGITIFFLLGALIRIQILQKEIIELNKEQHIQNEDIYNLLKYKQHSTEMLLQHIDILKYLCEQDPMLRKYTMPYMGPIGEA